MQSPGMRTTMTVFAASLASLILFTASAGADKNKTGFVRVTPEEVAWADRPGYDGVKFAVIQGDPSKPGVYVVRAKFSPGTMTRPHWHPEDRYVIVVKGLSLIHISEPTRLLSISYAVF